MEELSKALDMRTPIEIALDIDADGNTTAKKLYAFLELDVSHYKRWCDTNIINNEFAEENVDYFYSPSLANEQGRGNFSEDFKLTAHFAKKLSQKAQGIKGEQAREYFTTLEERVKQKAIDYTQLSPQLQMAQALLESQAKIELEQKRQAEQLTKLEANQKTIAETFNKSPDRDFRSWVKACITAISESENYPFAGNRSEKYQAVTAESYSRLNQKKPCRLKQRVEAEKGRASISGASTKLINSINKLTIIEQDKALKPIYETVLKEMMLAYCVEVA